MANSSGTMPQASDRTSYWFQGALFVVHLAGSETEGRFALLETLSPPGHTPPLHIHHHSDQTWYVLEGEITVHLPGHVSTHGPGSIAYGPRAVPHTHPVTSIVPARILEVTTPAGFENFLSEVADPATQLELPPTGDPPDLARIAEVAKKFGIELLGPPGSLP